MKPLEKKRFTSKFDKERGVKMKKLLILFVFFGSLYAADIYATFDVVSLRDSKLTLPVSGVVESLHVSVGDRVKKGDLLLELDVVEQQADIALAQSDIKLMSIAKDQAKAIYERYEKIQTLIDKEQFENVTFEYRKALQSVEKSKQQYKLKNIKLSKRRLYAPYDGVITDLHVELGDGVSGPNTPLISLSSFPEVKLVLSFDEKHWNEVKVGQVFIYAVDGLQKSLEGKISKVYPSINPQTRKLKAEVKTTSLLPGLFGDGKIIVK